MTKKVTGRELGKLLCGALELDPSKVLSISINCTPEYCATVSVTFALFEKEANKIVSIMKEYDLEQNDVTPEITGDDVTQGLHNESEKE